MSMTIGLLLRIDHENRLMRIGQARLRMIKIYKNDRTLKAKITWFLWVHKAKGRDVSEQKKRLLVMAGGTGGMSSLQLRWHNIYNNKGGIFVG